MFQKRFLCLLAVLTCLLSCGTAAMALETSSDAVYCFTAEDFSNAEDALSGICVTGLPAPSAGTVMLGSRVLQRGDILTADQLAQLTFCPVRSETDTDAVMTFLPIYEDRVEKSATVTIAVRGKEDLAPVAEDFTLETYKNLPNEGTLKVTDPEGQPMTYTVIRQSKRGTVELREDGSFVYTPKKNKVGVDSFTYTATDPAGKVSREATVTVQILKPTDDSRYTDTAGLDCCFEAEWLRNTGLFVGEQMGSSLCFQPEQTVSRGQFLAMVMQLLEVSPDEQAIYTQLAQDAPQWLQPYLTAAVRTGILSGLVNEDGSFDANSPITGKQAAMLLQNALALPVAEEDLETFASEEEAALAVLSGQGLMLEPEKALTRQEAAKLLYRVKCLAAGAPGLTALPHSA